MVHEKLIGIMVWQGRVTLTGTVGSLAEKQSALTDAWVSGVTAVDVDRLKVEWWARDRMLRNPGEMLSSEIHTEEAIRTALTYDPRLTHVEIAVRVIDGTAILTGTVDNMAAKYAAEETARNTMGIWRVHNMIHVQPTTPVSDEDLERRVRQAFNQHSLVDRYEMKIAARDGKVSLEGYLHSPSEISQTVRVAARVKGVTDVVNFLKLTSRGTSDEAIWEEIRRSFWWDPRLYDRDIRITVADGIATLEGTVPSLGAWRLAKELAKEAGAEGVRNNLELT